MRTGEIRALVTGAGSGAAGNIMRALQRMTPPVHIVGVGDDQFTLMQSIADRSYLCPSPNSNAFIDSLIGIVKRERINVIMPGDDHIVKALSDARRRIPVSMLLPQRKTVDLCQDKFALGEYLRDYGIPVPQTYEVRSLRSLESIFSRFRGTRVLWCRARCGARALGAAPVMKVEQARAWISLWRDLRGINVSEFTIGEYLPGRHFIVPSVWHNGRLLRAQTTEVLSYFAAGNNPSGIFSLSCLAKTVFEEKPLHIALDAVRALERRPNGAFSVELKERLDGVPALTEINVGRFPAGVAALVAAGKENMIEIFASATLDRPRVVAEPLGSDKEYYMVRDLDMEPGIFSSDGLIDKLGHAKPFQ